MLECSWEKLLTCGMWMYVFCVVVWGFKCIILVCGSVWCSYGSAGSLGLLLQNVMSYIRQTSLNYHRCWYVMAILHLSLFYLKSWECYLYLFYGLFASPLTVSAQCGLAGDVLCGVASGGGATVRKGRNKIQIKMCTNFKCDIGINLINTN